MRLSAYVRYKFTADVYDYTIANDANGTMLYSFKENVSLDFNNDPSAPRATILCDKPLRKNVHLLNVRDRDGNDVLPGAEFSITRVEPVLNIWGQRERFRMQAAMSNDPTFEEFDE